MNSMVVPVEKVARLVQSLTQEQKYLLLQLVPDLQSLHPPKISAEQLELMAYFQAKIDQLPTQKPLPANEIFINDLTVAEFFALPNDEQDRVWKEAHQPYESYTRDSEWSVQSDAIST